MIQKWSIISTCVPPMPLEFQFKDPPPLPYPIGHRILTICFKGVDIYWNHLIIRILELVYGIELSIKSVARAAECVSYLTKCPGGQRERKISVCFGLSVPYF